MKLYQSNIKQINKLGHSAKVNCWGSTQYALGVLTSPKWQNDTVMAKFLSKFTDQVCSNPKKGDILVIFNKRGQLIHTALFIDANTCWHKPGRGASKTTTKESVMRQYLDCGRQLKIRRFNQTSLDNAQSSKNTIQSQIYKQLLELF
jgi:hypothetical protein